MTQVSEPPTTSEATLAPPPDESGLTEDEAGARLAVYGPNRLVPEKGRSGLVAWLLRPLADPMVALLVVAGATYLVLQEYVDAIVTLVAVVPVLLVNLVLEVRAERALEQLARLTTPVTTVWRGDERRLVKTDELVPGDVVVLQEGDVIPADGELLTDAQLIVDESALTGESEPVTKDVAGASEARRLFAGTTVLAGRGVARIAVTGLRTRYGAIGALMAGIRQPPTPLERLIRRLVRQMGAVAVVFCFLVALLELARGAGWAAAIIAGVSLAMAAMPEEFPMVYTLYLTLGAWRLARGQALIRRLSGVETLGATTVICSDKTGTLTLGRLAVGAIATNGQLLRGGEQALSPEARALVEAAVLACEPSPFDPLEQALLRFASTHGIDVELLHRRTLLRDYQFDRMARYMSHVWQDGVSVGIYAKGATEGLLDLTRASDDTREQALGANRALADEGMRVIAVAAGKVQDSGGNRVEDERFLAFLGLIGFNDPLRPGVAEALSECRTAGIRVIMITGDHPVTAHAVAEGLGLPHEGEIPVATGDDLDTADDSRLTELVRRVNIFARTRPEQKYRLVQALRAGGEVVAMTGDGVNDAPALREADIGVAMGQRGTDVARAAATIVLLDDNFATIVGAVRDGRRIFENLRRAFSYLIAFHAPILLAALLIPLAGAPLLLLPIHLVVLEILLHPIVSLVFENDPAPAELMRRPPRKSDAALATLGQLARPLAVGITLFGGVLALFLLRLSQGAPEPDARALAFTTLVLGQTLLVLVERSPDRPLWQVSLSANRALLAVLLAIPVSLVAALSFPALTGLLKLAPLSLADWALATGLALVAIGWSEPLKGWRRLRHASGQAA